MSIIQFKPQKIANKTNDRIVRKIIDGQEIEFVNFDALTPEEQQRMFSESEDSERAEAFAPQPAD